MKLIQFTTLAFTLFSTGVLSHSWAECIDTVVPNKAEKEANPSLMSDDGETCRGYPRGLPTRKLGQVMAPDWVWESTHYSYEFNEKDTNGQIFACRANQRTPAAGSLPMATVTPGQTILIRSWGNGHTTKDPMYANPQNLDPGVTRVYWAGKKETELKYAKDLHEGNWIPGAQQAFEKGSIVEFTQDAAGTLVKVGPNAGKPQKRMKEWGAYMEFTVPEDIESGRHMMVWTWAWKLSGLYSGGDLGPKDGSKYNKNFENTFSTCFDIEVVNGGSGPSETMAIQSASYDPTADENNMCAQTCRIAGDASKLCDPKTSSCPTCRVTGNGGVDCFAECNDFIRGTVCPSNLKSAKFRRTAHAHSKHRRTAF